MLCHFSFSESAFLTSRFRFIICFNDSKVDLVVVVFLLCHCYIDMFLCCLCFVENMQIYDKAVWSSVMIGGECGYFLPSITWNILAMYIFKPHNPIFEFANTSLWIMLQGIYFNPLRALLGRCLPNFGLNGCNLFLVGVWLSSGMELVNN